MAIERMSCTGGNCRKDGLCSKLLGEVEMLNELARLTAYPLLALDCMRVTLMDVRKMSHVPRWYFLEIHSEDVASQAFGENTEVKHVHIVGALILPKCTMRSRVVMYHTFGKEWCAHSVEMRTWDETQHESAGILALFSATELRALFAKSNT